MRTRMVCLFILCLSVTLLLAGCADSEQAVVPVTGAESAIPAAVVSAHESVLKYVSSSSQPGSIPSNLDWKPAEKQTEGQYRYGSDGWVMVIWPGENQRVVIINKTENIYWCGYMKPDGSVVDVSYLP